CLVEQRLAQVLCQVAAVALPKDGADIERERLTGGASKELKALANALDIRLEPRFVALGGHGFHDSERHLQTQARQALDVEEVRKPRDLACRLLALPHQRLDDPVDFLCGDFDPLQLAQDTEQHAYQPVSACDRLDSSQDPGEA